MYAVHRSPEESTPSDEIVARREMDRVFLLRRRLDALYARRVSLGGSHAAGGGDDWDVRQAAFLHVLEHPPEDISERALVAALEAAYRAACGRREKDRRDDAQMRIGLRKRFPV